MVIHHTDCGLSTATDEQFRRSLMQNRDFYPAPPPSLRSLSSSQLLTSAPPSRAATPSAQPTPAGPQDEAKLKALRDLNGIKFGSMTKGKEGASVRDDVDFLKNSGWFDGMQIWGGVMNTETGIVTEVVGVEDDDDDDDDEEEEREETVEKGTRWG
jgi:carbonic anhydrase